MVSSGKTRFDETIAFLETLAHTHPLENKELGSKITLDEDWTPSQIEILRIKLAAVEASFKKMLSLADFKKAILEELKAKDATVEEKPETDQMLSELYEKPQEWVIYIKIVPNPALLKLLGDLLRGNQVYNLTIEVPLPAEMFNDILNACQSSGTYYDFSHQELTVAQAEVMLRLCQSFKPMTQHVVSFSGKHLSAEEVDPFIRLKYRRIFVDIRLKILDCEVLKARERVIGNFHHAWPHFPECEHYTDKDIAELARIYTSAERDAHYYLQIYFGSENITKAHYQGEAWKRFFESVLSHPANFHSKFTLPSGGTSMDKEVQMAILRALTLNPKLVELNIYHDLDEDVTSELVSLIAASQSLKTFTYCPNDESLARPVVRALAASPCPLERLTLAAGDSGDEMAPNLKMLLAKNSLVRLDLTRTNFSESAFLALADGLKTNTSVMQLGLSHHPTYTVEQLRLRNQCFSYIDRNHRISFLPVAIAVAQLYNQKNLQIPFEVLANFLGEDCSLAPNIKKLCTHLKTTVPRFFQKARVQAVAVDSSVVFKPTASRD